MSPTLFPGDPSAARRFEEVETFRRAGDRGAALDLALELLRWR